MLMNQSSRDHTLLGVRPSPGPDRDAVSSQSSRDKQRKHSRPRTTVREEGRAIRHVGRRLKVMTLVGTRPEIIKMSRIFAELDRHTDHVMVHSGQNYDYELNEVLYEDLGIRRPDHFLRAARETTAASIAAIIESADRVLALEAPDALVLYGDTNTCLAVIAAKRRKIPIFHLEAGNRSFDQRVPEELNRQVVDHLSDINLPPTEHARRYLLAEGIRPETVIKVGSPMREVLEHVAPQVEQSGVLDRLGLIAGEFFVVSAHREENVDDPATLNGFVDALRALPWRGSSCPSWCRPIRGRGSGWEQQVWAETFGCCDGFRPSGSSTTSSCRPPHGASCPTAARSRRSPRCLGFRPSCCGPHTSAPRVRMPGSSSSLFSRPTASSARQLVLDQQGSRRQPYPVPDYEPRSGSQTVARLVVSYTDHVNRTVWRRDDT